MDADKPDPVVNLPPVMFIGGTTNQGRTGKIKGAWDPDILLDMITNVGVPAEEDLFDIVMRSRKMVIHMECYVKAYWVMYIGGVWPTQSVDQWLNWLTKPPSG